MTLLVMVVLVLWLVFVLSDADVVGDAVVCVGCVVRGETPHFEFIASAVAHGITMASQLTGVPIAFGVLTTNNEQEAEERSSEGSSNKGREAALAAVQLANVISKLTQGK